MRMIQIKFPPSFGLKNVRHIGSANVSKDSKVIVFSDKRVVGYSPEQMFKVVADVDSYHKFVPYCRRSVVTLKKPNRLSANLNVGFQPGEAGLC